MKTTTASCCQPSRRQMLQGTALGFAHLALTGLLGEESRAAEQSSAWQDPLAPKAPHHAPRAKRIIFVFMKGGPSQVDTFDYKPLLQRDDGKPLPFEKPRVTFAPTGNLLA